MLLRRNKKYMSTVYLFRIKFVRGDNLALETEELTPEQIFRNAIEEKPTISLKANSVWLIGNIVYLDEAKKIGTFNIGKKRMDTVPKYNENSKDFETELEENSPNCKIFFNLEYEILGITNKHELSVNEFSLADKIKQLLTNTSAVRNAFKYVEITKVKNPETFISRLRGAYCIKKFGVHFSGVNPFDADEFFHKPMSAYLDATAGTKGYTVVEGKSLNAETCAKMASSVAATGNDAYARLQDSSDDKIVTVSMSRNSAKIIIPDDIKEDDKKIIEMMMNYYYKVRRNEA